MSLWELLYNRKVINNVIDTGTQLALLDDVNVLLPQNNEVLQFNSVSGKWENKSITGYTYKSLYRLNFAANSQTSATTTRNGMTNAINWLQNIAG